MKIVIIGGTGLIGSKVVADLLEHGHDIVSASPRTGVNTLTGEGLAEALADADTVVDVSNSPSPKFFETSTRNLLAAEHLARVGHYVVLSIVNCDRLTDSPYLRAKAAQERLISNANIQYSIIRATQFFEFSKENADVAFDGHAVRIPPVLFQPIAAADVANAVGSVAEGTPLNGVIEVAGPEEFRYDQFIRLGLQAMHDTREVIADSHARYFGAAVTERSLVPGPDAKLCETRFEDWLTDSLV